MHSQSSQFKNSFSNSPKKSSSKDNQSIPKTFLCSQCRSERTQLKTLFYRHQCQNEIKYYCVWCLYQFEAKLTTKDNFFDQKEGCCLTDIRSNLKQINNFLKNNCVICGKTCKSEQKIFLDSKSDLCVGKQCFFKLFISSNQNQESRTLAKIMRFNPKKCLICEQNKIFRAKPINYLTGQKFERQLGICQVCFLNQQSKTLEAYQLRKCRSCHYSENTSNLISVLNGQERAKLSLSIVQFQNGYYCVPCLYFSYQNRFMSENEIEKGLTTKRRIEYQKLMIQGCFCCGTKVGMNQQVYKMPFEISLNSQELLKHVCLNCINDYKTKKNSAKNLPNQIKFVNYVKNHYGQLDKEKSKNLKVKKIVFQMEVELTIMQLQKEFKSLQFQSIVQLSRDYLEVNDDQKQTKLLFQSQFAKQIQIHQGENEKIKKIQQIQISSKKNIFTDQLEKNANCQASYCTNAQTYNKILTNQDNIKQFHNDNFDLLNSKQSQSKQKSDLKSKDQLIKLSTRSTFQQTQSELFCENSKQISANFQMKFENLNSFQQQDRDKQDFTILSRIKNFQFNLNSLFEKYPELTQQTNGFFHELPLVEQSCKNKKCKRKQVLLNLGKFCQQCFINYLIGDSSDKSLDCQQKR